MPPPQGPRPRSLPEEAPSRLPMLADLAGICLNQAMTNVEALLAVTKPMNCLLPKDPLPMAPFIDSN